MNARKVDYIDGDTITAIATPVGSGGIGIIRISGVHSIDIAKTIFRKTKSAHQEIDNAFFSQIPSHQLTHGYIYDGQSQNIIDEVMLVVMKAPHSYTREDVVEIQSHCGPIILQKILRLVLVSGARMASPGEFTRRAFLNGRIDLVQAEAVGDLISAKSESALKLAITHLTGHMKDAVLTAIQYISDIQVEIEAGLEFGDEISLSEIDYEGLSASIKEKIISPINSLLEHYAEGYFLRDGIRLGIAGRPNVGKSSLLNALIRRDKAIVAPLPGTTRDLIEEHICIDGIPLVITDTAGLHDTEDPIETIGIQKARENINQSDIVLFVIDAIESFNEADYLAFKQLNDKKIIVVINKMDLMPDNETIRIPENYTDYAIAYISAKYGQGLEQLMALIKKQALGESIIDPGRSIVPNLRQKLCLESALDALLRAQEAISSRFGEELILVDLGEAKEALNEIIGYQLNNDILDQLFSTFCIGK